MRRFLSNLVLLGAFGAMVGCMSTPIHNAPVAQQGPYLFTYFTGNGQSGLHLAYSHDAYHWKKVEGVAPLSPKISAAKLMRDPSVAQGPDGTYHMVWTSGWTEQSIGYASTTDFIHWSEQRELPVMAHEASARNTWAPEIIFDETQQHFMIFWASTLPEQFKETAGSSEEGYNHRIYYTTTRDFTSFTPTQLLLDPGFSVIDASFFTFNNQLYLVVKNETRYPAKKYIKLAKADSFTGPFHEWSEPISPKGLWIEGPSTVVRDGEVIIYFDAYIDKYYGAIKSKDLINWEDVSEQMQFPDAGTPSRMRHGSAFTLDSSTLNRLLSE